jgi:hypothetical protein
VGVPWRSLGALSVFLFLFILFFGDLSMFALFLCYLGWGGMYDPYTPVHVLQGLANPQKSHFPDALGAPSKIHFMSDM